MRLPSDRLSSGSGDERGHGLLQRAEGRRRGAVGQADGQAVVRLADFLGHVDEPGRDDEGDGIAVVDHVGDLGGGEMPVDRHAAQPGPPHAPGHREVVALVTHEHGDPVADLAVLRQHTGQPVHAVDQLAVGERLPAPAHDDGRLVWIVGGLTQQRHVRSFSTP